MLLTGDLRCATLTGMKVPFNQWLQAKLKELKMTQAVTMKDALAARQLLATASPDDGVAAERAQAALDRLIDLYSSGDMTKDEYRRKRSELEARLPKALPSPSGLVVLEVGEVIRDVSLMMFRDIARDMIDRIEVGRGSLVIKLQEWCADWAP